ncbi:MAG: threonylcarbamoyl-AMP synthase [Cenarchaeum sp. SB0665_bin_23]|nr:threonylcarbamoyl-AMP synthase [Cenarchaeum sp. SB0665_bin_23]MYB47231.1 threonylcarbamoyl-AMP synthase [Cenarchaeum sp. SB0662_bin_33]MYG33358.1 threonylcarbamoyl-AMP synthase [Cenarchaeum sp. SB0677_bin_16]
MKRMEGVSCSDVNIDLAARMVQQGSVIVFPTDTVYGIGCDPYNRDGIQRIYDIKGRSRSKPLPVLAKSIDIIQQMAIITDNARRLAERFWPGPLTVILHMRRDGPTHLSHNNKIAVRIPDGACIKKLLDRCDCIVGSSANISGRGSSKTLQDIDVPCDMAIDGGVISSVGESSIVDATGDNMVVLRQGAISGEYIQY